MANAWENVSWIAEEALMHLEDALVLTGLTARDKSADFNVKPNGYAVGDTVSIKTRPEYKTQEFTTAIVKQEIRSSKRPMVIEKHFDISVGVTAKEKALNMDGFAEEVIVPAAYTIAESVDAYIGTKLLNAAGLYASDTLFSGRADVALARQEATLQQLQPNARICLVNDDLEATLLGADWFTRVDSRGPTGEAITASGEFAQTLGMRFFSSLNFPTDASAVTQGTFAATTDHAAGGNELIGGVLLPFDGGTGTGIAGDHIKIAGVKRPMVVVSGATGASGNVTVRDPITEVIPDNAAITTVGSGQDVIRKGIILDNNSVATAFPVLDPASDKPSSVISNNGVSIRVVQGYDMDSKQDTLSLDVLCGAEAYDPRRMTLLGEW